jgi:hypothetical protein
MATIRAWAILDSGMTSHFLTTAAPMTNMRPPNKPIIARLPYGERVHSTHTCTLNISALPASAQHAHIIPSLASHSLFFDVNLCNVGCNATFTKIGCTITFCGKIILCGSKCTCTGLWMIPLCSTLPSIFSSNLAIPTPTIIAANVEATSSAGDYACYIHQTFLHSSGNYAYIGPETKQGTCNHPQPHCASYQHPPALFHSYQQGPHEAPPTRHSIHMHHATIHHQSPL